MFDAKISPNIITLSGEPHKIMTIGIIKLSRKTLNIMTSENDDRQPNDIQHNHIEHNDNQHNDTRHCKSAAVKPIRRMPLW